MSTMSRESVQYYLHYDSYEEITCSCPGGFIGFRNQLFDCSSSELKYEDSEELFEINLKGPLDTISEEDCESSVFSLDIHNKENDVVHVAVDHVGESSMEALLWALKYAVTPFTTVYLIHVFPEIRLLPSPFGKFPRSHVNPEYVNFHLTQQKGKIKVLLQKFVDLCLESKVKVEIMLIEDDNVVKAITDLVRDHSIRKLVIGITKSNLSKSVCRRKNTTADKILKNAPEICDIKIICAGKEVIDKMIGCTPSCSGDSSSLRVSEENESRVFVPLMRFVPNPIWLFRPRFN